MTTTVLSTTARAMTWSSMESPVGTLRLCAADGRLRGVYLPGHRPAPACPGGVPVMGDAQHARDPDDVAVLRAATRQLAEYFDGVRTAFDLPQHAEGTPFQRIVWSALCRIPYGTTWSYARLAQSIGRGAGAARAVGAANSRNPLSIIVPCHRVIARDGRLAGYAGGEPAKRWLLDHEALRRA